MSFGRDFASHPFAALVHKLVRVTVHAGRKNRLSDPTTAHHLRSRTEPSWATDATSVPSGLKIRPRVRPRPPCALGESCAYSSHSSARNGRWNHIAWSRLAG